MAYWLIKSEPHVYPYSRLIEDQQTIWDGVRNFQARNYMMQMEVGDLALYYHSGDEKQMVGIARITGAHYPDPTAQEGNWVVVEVSPAAVLDPPITLHTLKEQGEWNHLPLIRQSRLSVMPIEERDYHALLKLTQVAWI